MRGSIPLLLILLVGLCAHHNAFHAAFVADDRYAILDNPEIRDPALAIRPRTEFTAARPVATLTFAANYALTGFDPLPFHATNLLIHLLAAMTLFALARRTFLSPRLAPRFADHATPLALAAALLFVAHPLTTEVVDYTLQRTESLMALFALLTLYCLARALSEHARLFGGAARSADPARHRRRATASRPHPRLFFALAVLCCLLAMGCKQTAYAVPLLAAAYHRAFFAPSWRGVFRSHRRLYPALAATWLALACFQLARTWYPAVGFFTPRHPGLTPWHYLLTQATVLPHYLRLVFYPHPLVIDYSDWPVATSLLSVLPLALVIAALVIACFYYLLRRGSPAAFVGCAIFLVLAPTSSILPLANTPAAERRTYLPLAFLLPLLVAAIDLLLQPLIARRTRRRPATAAPTAAATAAGRFSRADDPIGRRPATGGSRFFQPQRVYHPDAPDPSDAPSPTPLLLVAFYAAFIAITLTPLILLTTRRSAAYADRVALWADLVDYHPGNVRALCNLAAARIDAGDPAGAIAPLERALKQTPDSPAARRTLAAAHLRLGHTTAAVDQYRLAVAINDDGPGNLGLGQALLAAGQPAQALPHLARAAELSSSNPAAHDLLGQALLRTDQPDPAIDQFLLALDLDPDRPQTACRVAQALLLKHQPAAAAAALRRALSINHDHAPALVQLAHLLATCPDPAVRNPAEAVVLARHALALAPTDPAARDAFAQAKAADDALDAPTTLHAPPTTSTSTLDLP